MTDSKGVEGIDDKLRGRRLEAELRSRSQRLLAKNAEDQRGSKDD